MDIISTIGKERKYLFHSHTQFCDGKATMDAMAAEAVKNGFRFYGFSPHSPLEIESPCNMKCDDVKLYFDEVERIKHKYTTEPIRFFSGMEIDYLHPGWGPATDYFQSLPLDFRIASVHFIPNQYGDFIDVDGCYDNFKKKMKDCFRNDIEYVVHTFYQQSQSMLSEGGFDILGHFDKIGLNASYFAPGIEESDFYYGEINPYIQEIIKTKPIVEINTKAIANHNRVFPRRQWLEPLVNSGVPIIVNSDAHSPEDIDINRSIGFKILDEISKCHKH